MIINNKFEDPYNKFPPPDSMPILSRALVNSKLTIKFWKVTKNIFESTLKGDAPKLKNIKVKNDVNDKNNINNKNEENQINNNNMNPNEDNNIENIAKFNKDSKINEEELKKFYFEKCQLLKLENEKCNKIILEQDEENKTLIKRIEQLEKILNNRINLNDI